jgi:predicted DNA-binding protein YlxM (UPF0122 family)
MGELSGQKIADELDITRQAVAQTVKRALTKIYKNYQKEYPWLSPFELAAKILSELDIEINKKNYNCFAPNLKKKIKASAKVYAEERNYLIPE